MSSSLVFQHPFIDFQAEGRESYLNLDSEDSK